LTQAEWDAPEILRQTALDTLRQLGWKAGDTLYVLIDDTQKRKRGKRMDAVCKLFLHAEKVYAKGHTIAACALVYRGVVIPYAVRLWANQAYCKGPQKLAPDEPPLKFRKLTQLAADMIAEVAPPSQGRVIVLFDSYYLCPAVTKALAARNIRLMVYLPSGAPAADPVARKALGWRWGSPGGWQLPGEPVGGRLAEFQRNWEAVIRDWSLRWGKSVSGWWIDGCYFADQMYRFHDEPNFASFARALKAGNPEGIVAFNPGVRVPVVCHTKYEDYTAGEVNLPELAKAVETCPGRWLEREGRKAQFHILTFLGTTWCGGDRPQLPNDRIVAYTRKIAAKGGVVTYDVPILKSGLIPQPFVEQLPEIGQSLR
jgi:hypothetical protein